LIHRTWYSLLFFCPC